MHTVANACTLSTRCLQHCLCWTFLGIRTGARTHAVPLFDSIDGERLRQPLNQARTRRGGQNSVAMNLDRHLARLPHSIELADELHRKRLLPKIVKALDNHSLYTEAPPAPMGRGLLQPRDHLRPRLWRQTALLLCLPAPLARRQLARDTHSRLRAQERRQRMQQLGVHPLELLLSHPLHVLLAHALVPAALGVGMQAILFLCHLAAAVAAQAGSMGTLMRSRTLVARACVPMLCASLGASCRSPFPVAVRVCRACALRTRTKGRPLSRCTIRRVRSVAEKPRVPLCLLPVRRAFLTGALLCTGGTGVFGQR